MENNRGWWLGLLGCGCALLLMAVLGGRLLWKGSTASSDTKPADRLAMTASSGWRAGRGHRSAKEIVAAKVIQFGRNRLKIAEKLAARAGVEVPADVKAFFAAVEADDWDEIDRIFTELNGLMRSHPRSKDLEACWPAVMDTLGCAAEARKWPAEKLLDYADAILGSLRSGMVYIGGTDPGRFIPTLVNETSSGEKHVVITQNALADRLYLDYVGFLYQDRLSSLTQAEQDATFAEYITDAKRRFEHDLKYPDEPRQLTPGEIIRYKDGDEGDVVAEGQNSVMAVNERLLRRLMEKNPDMSFAIEESFPMKSTYAAATLMGPILELRADGAGNELTPRKAAQAVEYWRTTRDELALGKEDSAFPVLATWSKMAAAQANLFTDRNLLKEAEETYRLAQQIFPGCPEAAYGLAQLLAGRGQTDEAHEMISEFQANHSVVRAGPASFPRVEAAP